jgi:hypothetical protein
MTKKYSGTIYLILYFNGKNEVMLQRKSSTVPAAIENVYKAFSSVQKPKKIWVDYYYADDPDNNVFNTKPLRNLTCNDLDKYSLDVADKEDILYLLPRYLELFYIEDYYPIAFFFYAITKCEWDLWPLIYKESVGNYSIAVLSTFNQEAKDVLDWFCAFSKLFTIEGKYLDLLLQDTPESRSNLIYLYEKASHGLPGKLKLGTDFLGLPPTNPNYPILLNWLNREDVFEKVVAAYAV